jgi:hypothetical protein
VTVGEGPPTPPLFGGKKVSDVMLVYGEPNQGKSALAYALLGAGKADGVYATDHAYVSFVKKCCPRLLTPDLYLNIQQHYCRHWTELVPGWHAHLVAEVGACLPKLGRLVVEGWHVTDALHALVACATQMSCRVEVVWACRQRYLYAGKARMLEGVLGQWPRPC